MFQGFSIHEDGLVIPMSKVIGEGLGIPCAALSGANLATEVAQEQFCESTIGCEDEKMGQLLKDLFETPYFRVAVVPDRQTVEACGALKVSPTPWVSYPCNPGSKSERASGPLLTISLVCMSVCFSDS